MGAASAERELGAFVIGTGRNGSTLLATLLGDHPQVLSVSEFLAAVRHDPFPPGAVSGDQMWNHLTEPDPAISFQLARHLEPSEFLYDLDGGRRFNRSTGVAPIAAITLPHLTPDPDALLDELGAVVVRQPMQTAREHYVDIFDWLVQRFDREVWVERSGGSALYLKQLVAEFPDARYVHLYRNGPDTVMSMRAAVEFRFEVIRAEFLRTTGWDPYGREPSPPGWAPPEDLLPVAPASFDRESFLAGDVMPLELYGAMWSRMTRTALRTLAKLPPEQCHVLCYDELVMSPDRELTALGAFLGLADVEAWVERAAASIKPRPSQTSSLTADEQGRLAAACRPGERELGRYSLDPHSPI